MSKVSCEINRMICLCVDSYERGEMRGRYYHPSLGIGGRTFNSMMQFLISAENLFDTIDFPQAFTAKRSFARASNTVADDFTNSESRTGDYGTFIIHLLCRQHTSWQGCVTWLESGEKQPFRSVLELIFLVDSALSACEVDALRASQADRGESA